jgi:cytochrome oxidase Cu insertion factor (SCO1/SenC/PrrC family)
MFKLSNEELKVGKDMTLELEQPMIGEGAPAFTLPSTEGARVSLSDLRGKFTVIHFGTSW